MIAFYAKEASLHGHDRIPQDDHGFGVLIEFDNSTR